MMLAAVMNMNGGNNKFPNPFDGNGEESDNDN